MRDAHDNREVGLSRFEMAVSCAAEGPRQAPSLKLPRLNAAAGEGGLHREGLRRRIAGQAAVEGIEDS